MTQSSASDRKSIRAAEKDAAQLLAANYSVVQSLMSSVDGRRFIWDYLSSCRIFSQSMVDSDRWTSFNEGRRSAGSELLDLCLAACPELYILAMREANERSNLERVRNRPAESSADLGIDHNPNAGIDFDPDADRIETVN